MSDEDYMTQPWSAEYSVDQQCFHVGPMAEQIRTNKEAIAEGLFSGYQIFYIGTHEECNEACNLMARHWKENNVRTERAL